MQALSTLFLIVNESVQFKWSLRNLA